MQEFAYFQEQDSEQFAFYKIPKVLFTDPRFNGISTEAKIMYGVMLDRVSLSRKNGWIDKNGNVYIQFTLSEMMEYFHWTKYTRPGNNLYVVNRDWTISHVGWAGHMAFQSAKRIGGQEMIRVDYERYLLGEENFVINKNNA